MCRLPYWLPRFHWHQISYLTWNIQNVIKSLTRTTCPVEMSILGTTGSSLLRRNLQRNLHFTELKRSPLWWGRSCTCLVVFSGTVTVHGFHSEGRYRSDGRVMTTSKCKQHCCFFLIWYFNMQDDINQFLRHACDWQFEQCKRFVDLNDASYLLQLFTRL